LIGHGRNDDRNEFVLDREKVFGGKRTIVGFGPEMGSGRCVHELNGDAKPGARRGKGARISDIDGAEYE
jgi:hypothetical protein